MALLLATLGIDSGDAFMAITLLVLPIAAIAFAAAGPGWERVGGGRFAMEKPLPRSSRAGAPEPPVDRALQATEARQMLEAKSYRLRRSGRPAIDVDAEVARALASEGDSGGKDLDRELRAEVRELVVARNERLIRRGEEPLDVDAETERQLADLIRLGE